MAYCFNPVCPQPQNSSVARFCQTCGTPLVLENRYRLVSLLGQGGFGRTFLAELADVKTADVETINAEALTVVSLQAPQRQCVVKQIHQSAAATRPRFRSEAERLRKLGDHPQIPRLLDAFETQLGQFLVQEFAPGENLQQQVEKKGPWDEDEVRSLLKSLVAVLQYVHSFQIIHRDIKPDNIVSSPGGRPMLVDFGSAKWVRQNPAKTVIGSAGYAAPEQSMGQATFASDIYSLGLTCLHMLTAVHPFGLYSAAEDRWVWRDYLTSPIEPRLAQVLDQMVARSLQQRYESMDQVDLDLKFSQRLLLSTPKQLFTQAKKSMPGLRTFIQTEGRAAVARLISGGSVQSLSSAEDANALSRVTQSWRRSHRLAPGIGLTQALAVRPDGQMLASGGSDGAVRLWELSSGQLTHTFARRRLIGSGHRGAISALAFHPDGLALYSASADGTVKEWNLAERRLLNTLPVYGWTPADLLVTPDGKQLMSANRDGKIVVWEIASLLPTAQLSQHQRCVNAIAFSPGNTYSNGLLISASDDGTVKLWKQEPKDDHLAPQLTKTITLPEETAARKGMGGIGAEKARAIAVAARPTSQHGQQLVVATEHTVLLYHIDAYLEVSTPITLCQSAAAISAIALNAEALLAVGSEDRQLALWQLTTGDRVAELAHDWGVRAIAFSPDGKALVTASADEVISIWQRET